jgi:hypothetical protein
VIISLDPSVDTKPAVPAGKYGVIVRLLSLFRQRRYDHVVGAQRYRDSFVTRSFWPLAQPATTR